MHLLVISTILTPFFARALASDQSPLAVDLHAWHPAGVGDLRGPCPALNALANHGYLPRDGRGISIIDVLTVCEEVFNVTPEALTFPAHLALLTSPTGGNFTLEDIRLHNNVEHDASLSRSDFALFGDNYSFNETIFKTLLNSNPGFNYYSPISTALVMKKRLEDSIRINPNVTNTIKEITIRSGESALFLTTMGDPLTGNAPKNFVQILFREERLPIEEGWTKPLIPVSLELFNNFVSLMISNVGWTPSPGLPTVAIRLVGGAVVTF